MLTLITKNWKIDNIETIFFDKDGTFIDLHYFWGKMTEMRASGVIKRYGLNTDSFNQICAFLGYDTNSGKMLSDGITALYSRVKIIEIFKSNLENLGILTTESDITEIFDSVSQEFYKDMTKYTKPIVEAVNFIEQIRKMGIKTGIITSDSVESTNLTLQHFHWENLFDVVIGRESSSATKESGIPTKMALDEINANPKTTIMIGDAPMDYISAKNAGIERTILTATGQIALDELKNTSPYALTSLGELTCIKTE